MLWWDCGRYACRAPLYLQLPRPQPLRTLLPRQRQLPLRRLLLLKLQRCALPGPSGRMKSSACTPSCRPPLRTLPPLLLLRPLLLPPRLPMRQLPPLPSPPRSSQLPRRMPRQRQPLLLQLPPKHRPRSRSQPQPPPLLPLLQRPPLPPPLHPLQPPHPLGL